VKLPTGAGTYFQDHGQPQLRGLDVKRRRFCGQGRLSRTRGPDAWRPSRPAGPGERVSYGNTAPDQGAGRAAGTKDSRLPDNPEPGSAAAMRSPKEPPGPGGR